MGLMDKLSALKERRLGFHIDECMTGTHELEPGGGPQGSRFMEFRVRWGPRDVLTWADPRGEQFMTQPMEGTITIDGLCRNTPCQGTFELKYFTGAKIRYTLHFEVDGTAYTYVGEKLNIRPWNLPVSHTTCFGTLIESDSKRLISRSITFFRFRTALSFAGSFRLAVAD